MLVSLSFGWLNRIFNNLHTISKPVFCKESKMSEDQLTDECDIQSQKQELEKLHTQVEEDNYREPKSRCIKKIQILLQAEERVRKTSSDLRREIIDLGGIENLIELHKKRKNRKKKVAPPPGPEPEVQENTGPVEASDFIQAAVEGKTKVIDRFLEDGGNPDSCDEFKRTALHRASLEGHIKIVQKLLDKGADVNFRDRLDCSCLHWACRGGKLEVLRILQNRGADLNVKDKLLSTPLHVAARTGRFDIAEHLISCGIKINSKDREGDTALHDAIRLNRYKIVRLLILHGADMKAKNAEGKTPTQLVQQWQWDTKDVLERMEQRKDSGMEKQA